MAGWRNDDPEDITPKNGLPGESYRLLILNVKNAEFCWLKMNKPPVSKKNGRLEQVYQGHGLQRLRRRIISAAMPRILREAVAGSGIVFSSMAPNPTK